MRIQLKVFDMDSEKTIVVRLKKVGNLLDRFMTGVKADIDRKVGETKNISAIQGRIILYLHAREKHGEVFQKDIETHFDMRSSTAAIILGRMEKNGLITREISDTDVRKRKKSVSLTAKAKRLHPQAQTGVENAERRVTKGLTRQELNVLVKVLDKITKNIS